MIKIDSTDPISKLLRDKLKLGGVEVFLYLLVWACIWRFALPFFISLGSIPMKYPPDLNGLLLAFIETPVIWAYYVWSGSLIPNIFNSVLSNNLLNNSDDVDRYKNFLQEVQKSFCRKSWFNIAMGLALLFSIVQVVLFWPNNPQIWYQPEKFPFYGFVEIFTYTLSQFMVFTVILRLFIVAYWLSKLFSKFDTVVLLQHPDKAGGWLAVGNHAGAVSFFIVGMVIWAIGLVISPQIPDPYMTFTQIASWISFTLLAPLCFFLPMLSTHQAMKKYKYSTLDEISKRINSILDETKITWSRGVEKKTNYSKMDELRLWYKLLEAELPEWPFSRDLFRGVLSSWFLPIISGFFSTYVQDMVKKYLP